MTEEPIYNMLKQNPNALVEQLGRDDLDLINRVTDQLKALAQPHLGKLGYGNLRLSEESGTIP